jgi:2-polyprenyl-3-methyl-5-hydroxy-6-metoxy-1,4-benzoquinol methylase
LASQLKCSVTIFDFPGMLAAQESFYQSQGFRAVGGDIAQYQATADAEPFDLILSSEIVEHIPEAPSRHIGRFRPHLKAGGVLVITTPNLGAFRNLVKFALQRAVLEKPEYSFLPPTFENEQYHRREYMPGEIRAALESCALRPERLEFSMNSVNRPTRDLVFMPFEKLVPRWRLTQIATARAR